MYTARGANWAVRGRPVSWRRGVPIIDGAGHPVLVYASYQLGRTLIEHDLVDELRLFVFPVVIGAGARLFGDTTGTRPFRLAGSRTVGDGLLFVTYEIARSA